MVEKNITVISIKDLIVNALLELNDNDINEVSYEQINAYMNSVQNEIIKINSEEYIKVDNSHEAWKKLLDQKHVKIINKNNQYSFEATVTKKALIYYAGNLSLSSLIMFANPNVIQSLYKGFYNEDELNKFRISSYFKPSKQLEKYRKADNKKEQQEKKKLKEKQKLKEKELIAKPKCKIYTYKKREEFISQNYRKESIN